jgi:capsule assembly protein Wzi
MNKARSTWRKHRYKRNVAKAKVANKIRACRPFFAHVEVTSFMKRIRWLALVLAFFAICQFSPDLLARSFSSPNVPVEDPIYRDLDKLIAFGLVKDAIYGQRPWSRKEIARLIGEAMKKRKDEREPVPGFAVDEILDRLQQRFHDELVDLGTVEGESKGLRVSPLEEARFNETILDSPFRRVPVSNGLGQIDALINPLVAYQNGRHFVDGNTLSLETLHEARLSRFFSLNFNPRLEGLVPNTGSNEANFIVNTLYGKFTIHNFEIEAGRDEFVWGHGEHGGVLASTNTRGLDMIKISNDSPFFFPWIFRYIGPSKFTFFVANLGPEYVFKDAFVYGLAASIKPVSFLELGFEHQVTTGGDGAPPIGPLDLISEFFLVRRSGSHENNGPNLADHRFGLNLRATFPFLRNTVFYAEGIFEDFGRASFWPQFTEQMAFQSGIYIPLLTSGGADDLRIQYEHIPAAYGRHSQWISGLALNRRLRGSETGPDGQNFMVEWRHGFSGNKALRISFDYDNRDSDIYTTTLSSSGGPDRVVKAVDNVTEHRIRLTAGFSWPLRRDVRLDLEAGYERAHNAAFVRHADDDNFLGSLSLTYAPNFSL